jgi:hypothetical protein
MKTNTFLHLMTIMTLADIIALSQLQWTLGESLAIGLTMTLNVALTLRYALR